MKDIFKKNNYIIVAILGLFVFAACNFDVLDQDPVDSFNEESLFADVNLVEAFLFQCYDNMGGDNREEVLGMREDLLSSATDETLNIHRAADVTFTKGSMTPDNLRHFGNWRYSWLNWDYNYANIKDVNTLLGGIEDVPTTNVNEEKQIEQIKAEAYFIRAFNYTNLLRSYGGLVLVDKKFELQDDFSTQTRSSLKETVDFILADIDIAIAGLPEKSDIEQGRATKGAAAALKSRLLSFVSGELMNGGHAASDPLVSFTDSDREGRLRAAKNAAKEVMDGSYGHYELTGSTVEPPAVMTEEDIQAYADNYAGIFLQKGTWDNEIIFGVQFLNRQGNRARNNIYWGPNGYSCWGNNEPTEDMVRKFEMSNGEKFQWDKYKPGEENIRAFTKEQANVDPEMNPYVGREPRFYANVLYDGAPWRDRAATNNKIQIGHSFAAPGAPLLNKDITALMNDIDNLESVQTGGYDSRSAANQAWNGTKTGYYLNKMLDPDIDGEIDNNENTWVEMRLAEVILDYAEACIELGEIEEGMKAVNTIRNRAGLPSRLLSVSQDQAREWYRHERLIEMFAEGDRWYTIRKWMIAEDVIKSFSPTYIYHFNDGVSIYARDISVVADSRSFDTKNYWLPLSRTELNKAPQLQQNPGYNK